MKYSGNQFIEIHIKWTHPGRRRSAAHLAPCILVAKVNIMHPKTTSLSFLPKRAQQCPPGSVPSVLPRMQVWLSVFVLVGNHDTLFSFSKMGRGLLFSRLSFLFTLKSSISRLLSFTCFQKFLRIFSDVSQRIKQSFPQACFNLLLIPRLTSLPNMKA